MVPNSAVMTVAAIFKSRLLKMATERKMHIEGAVDFPDGCHVVTLCGKRHRI